MNLLIAVPSHGAWEAAFGHSLALTMAHLAANAGPSQMRLVRCEGSKLTSNRMELVREAMKVEADRILWLDTDMAFRPDNVRALLAHDLDIVAANYPKKTPQQESVCAALDGAVLKKGAGLEEVAQAGMGMMVTKTEVFRRLPKPWFQFSWDIETEDDIAEDFFFCRKARQHGFKVHVDHDASVGVGHVGRFTFMVS
jgi:hypothetical protein